jgi:hypothetical protein
MRTIVSHFAREETGIAIFLYEKIIDRLMPGGR